MAGGVQALEILLHLRGFYIKIGQVGSTRHDFVPKEYLEKICTLQVHSRLPRGWGFYWLRVWCFRESECRLSYFSEHATFSVVQDDVPAQDFPYVKEVRCSPRHVASWSPYDRI